jgi:sigma-B regulation protein RsbU (phosphoserine phosphatase)
MSPMNSLGHWFPPLAHDEAFARHLLDLEGARCVQQNLFPTHLPRAPGWEWAAHCRPARVVAGDYHDLFEVVPGQVAVVLGDVSGKGLGAALVMAGLHAVIRCRLAALHHDLAALTAEVNAYLARATPPEMFVSLFLAVLDLATGGVRYVNAGHLPPLLLPDRDARPLKLAAGGTVLGVMPDAEFAEGEVCLCPGGLLTVFSDGVTEAMNADGQMFREARLVGHTRAIWGSKPEQVLSHLLDAVEGFTGRKEQADDVTLVVIRRPER